MPNLEIKKFKEPVLRKKCEGVKEITPGIKELVFDMSRTMRENNGAGLAAPQVGVLKRIIVVQPDLTGSETLALINPKIIKESPERETAEEGCLSFPGIFLEIERAKEVEVEALDVEGKKLNIKAEGLFSRVLQHEIDHLEGILFFQRLGFWKRLKFMLKHNL